MTKVYRKDIRKPKMPLLKFAIASLWSENVRINLIVRRVLYFCIGMFYACVCVCIQDYRVKFILKSLWICQDWDENGARNFNLIFCVYVDICVCVCA